MFNLLSGFLIDDFLPYAKWATIALAAVTLIAVCLFFFLDKQNGKKNAKRVFLCFFVYCLLIALFCLILDVSKHYSTEYLEENWLDKDYILSYVLYPVIALAVGILLSFTVLAVISKKQFNCKKYVKLTVFIIDVALIVFTLVMLAKYYNAKINDDGYYNSDTAKVNTIVLYIGAALLVCLMVGVAFIIDKDKTPFNTKCLASAGICLATSFCLSYVKIFKMPQGGSITLASLLPLCIFSFKYGARKGVLVCFAYGVLQAVQDPWLIHPAQFMLDYPIAFTSIGLAGLFKSANVLEKYPQLQFVFGAVLSGALRYICHTLSGVFAFAAYAKGANPFTYSILYNSYVLMDIAIVVILGAIVFSSKAVYNELINRN